MHESLPDMCHEDQYFNYLKDLVEAEVHVGGGTRDGYLTIRPRPSRSRWSSPSARRSVTD